MALGLERFLEGDPVTYEDVMFWRNLKACPLELHISNTTTSVHLEIVTPDEAKQLITRSKLVGEAFAAKNPSFAAVWQTDKRIFHVAYDYGMGAVGVAEEVDNEFRWKR